MPLTVVPRFKSSSLAIAVRFVLFIQGLPRTEPSPTKYDDSLGIFGGGGANWAGDAALARNGEAGVGGVSGVSAGENDLFIVGDARQRICRHRVSLGSDFNRHQQLFVASANFTDAAQHSQRGGWASREASRCRGSGNTLL